MSDQQWIEIAVAVVAHDNQFLVGVRDAATSLPGKAEFPGGKIEPGETPEVAAVRECLEETGLVVEAIGALGEQRERYEHGAVHLRFVDCRVSALRGLRVGEQLPNVASPWRWVSRSELSSLDFPRGNRHLIRQLVGKFRPASRGPHA